MLNSENTHSSPKAEDNHIVRVFANNAVHQVDIIEIQGKLVINNNYVFRDDNKENLIIDNKQNTTINAQKSEWSGKDTDNNNSSDNNIDNIQKQNSVSMKNDSNFLPLGKIALMENGSKRSKRDNEKVEPQKCILEIGTSIRVNGSVQAQSRNGKVLLVIKKIQNKECITSKNEKVSSQDLRESNTNINSDKTNKVELFSDWLARNKEALTLNACFSHRDTEQECRYHKRDRSDQKSVYAEVNNTDDNVEYTDYEIIGIVHRRFHFSDKPTRVFM